MWKILKQLYVWGILAAILGVIVMGYIEQPKLPPGMEEIASRRMRYCIGEGKRIRYIRCVLAQMSGKSASFYYVEEGTPIPKLGMPASGGSLQPAPGGVAYEEIREETGAVVPAPDMGGGAPEIPERPRRVGANGGDEEEAGPGARRSAPRPMPRPVQPMHH